MLRLSLSNLAVDVAAGAGAGAAVAVDVVVVAAAVVPVLVVAADNGAVDGNSVGRPALTMPEASRELLLGLPK